MYVTELVIEEFPSKCGRSNGGAQKAEASGEFCGNGWCEGVGFVGLEGVFAMVLDIEAERVGSKWERVGSGERPEVEVGMHVFIGLTKQPSGFPSAVKWSQRNSRSLRGDTG